MHKPECNELAVEVASFYGVCKALTHGWDSLPEDRVSESIEKLRNRVNKLRESGQIDAGTTHKVIESLKTMEKENFREAHAKDVKDILMPVVVDMMVDSIGGCVCGSKKAGGTRPVVSFTEITNKANELGGIYDSQYQQVVFHVKENWPKYHSEPELYPPARQFADWIEQYDAYNIQFNPFEVSKQFQTPAIAVIFDLPLV